MKNLLLILTILFSLFFFQRVEAQTKVQIVDAQTEQSIPFVKVYPNTGSPILADIDGRFYWSNDWNEVRLSYAGYIDTTYAYDAEVKILKMAVRVQTIDEVTVVPGENPAHRIMDLVIANRKKNNPLDNDAFRYQSYTKFVTEIDEEVLKSISDTTTDSSLISARDFISTTNLFMIETSSIRTFVPPSRDKEEIVAYKVSGFKDPMFATVAQEMQSFSFYENQFNILGKTYINPIAFGGTRRYLFILEDTTYVGTDTIFHIRYRPRKGKSFDGLKGVLYINSFGYAVERVTAEPAERKATEAVVTIVQEYQLLDRKKWFPSKLSSEIEFPAIAVTVGDSAVRVVSKSNTYIDSVIINPDKVKRLYFDNANVIIQNGAENKSDSTWNDLRKYELTEKEKNTYTFIDSLSEAEHLDRYLYGMKVLATGKIPLKYFNSDLMRLLAYNDYEGIRLGAGLETSDRLFKPASLGGYFAYGFRDQSWKWGGNLDIHLYRKKNLKLSLNYIDDVEEKGGRPYAKDMKGYTSTSQFRGIYVNYMDRFRRASAELSSYVTSNFRLGAVAGYERISFLQGYQYYPFDLIPTGDYAPPLKGIDNFYLTGNITWSIGEKVLMLGDTRVSKGTKYPTLFLSASKALSGVYDSRLNYLRFYGEVFQKISIRGIGKFNYTLAAGLTEGNAPLTYSQGAFHSNLTKNKINLSVANTFETLNNTGYFFKEHVALFTRFDFNQWKKYKKFRPQISVHHAIGFGTAFQNGTGVWNQPVQDLSKGYFEAGILFNQILMKSYGLGVFYNYGPYSQPDALKNFTLKLTLKPSFF